MRCVVSPVIKKEQVMQLVGGICPLPKKLLGRHLLLEGQIIAAYHPDAVRMDVIRDDGTVYVMDMAERQPVFYLFLSHQEIFPYRLRISFRKRKQIICRDPYSFPCQITEEEKQKFMRGEWKGASKKMGSHFMEIDGVPGMYFAVWAPRVKAVSLVGDFNDWDGRLYPMNRMDQCEIFELFLPEVEEGVRYQYEMRTLQRTAMRVSEPYGTAEGKGEISRILNVEKYHWDGGI